ncbi:unnamed protein product [Amoebophrya sp. A120]|nr:unnamed protein product [Amoebophrya sp. A120]|eukprot:GSA120T00014278001.1
MMQFMQHAIVVRCRSPFLHLILLSLFTAFNFSGVLQKSYFPRQVSALSTGGASPAPGDDRREAPSSSTHHKFLERRDHQQVAERHRNEDGVLDHLGEEAVLAHHSEAAAGGELPTPPGVAPLAQQVESDRFYSEVKDLDEAVKRNTQSDSDAQTEQSNNSFLQPRRRILGVGDDGGHNDGRRAAQQHQVAVEHIAREHDQSHLTHDDVDDGSEVGMKAAGERNQDEHTEHIHKNAEMVLSPDGESSFVVQADVEAAGAAEKVSVQVEVGEMKQEEELQEIAREKVMGMGHDDDIIPRNKHDTKFVPALLQEKMEEQIEENFHSRPGRNPGSPRRESAAAAPPTSLEERLLRLEQQQTDLQEENKRLKEQLEHFRKTAETRDAFYLEALQRIRYCGGVTMSLIRFLLAIFFGETRTSQVLSFELCVGGYLAILLGTLLAWKKVFFPGKAKPRTHMIYVTRDSRDREDRERRLAALAAGGAPGGEAGSTTMLGGDDAGDARGTATSAGTTTRGTATSAGTRGTAASEQGAAANINQTGISDLREENPPSPSTSATAVASGSSEHDDDSTEPAELRKLRDALPEDFLERGTLSCVCQDQTSLEGKSFTIALILYMVATLLNQYPLHSYRSWCRWKKLSEIGDHGDPGLPRLAVLGEIVLRCCWLIVPSFCFVVTAVIPSKSETGRNQNLYVLIHNFAANAGCLTLLIFETIQLLWGENVPIGYLGAVFDKPYPLDHGMLTKTRTASTSRRNYSVDLFDNKDHPRGGLSAVRFGNNLEHDQGLKIYNSLRTTSAQHDVYDVPHEEIFRDPYLWHIGCLDYETSPRPWETVTWLRLVVIAWTWLMGSCLFFQQFLIYANYELKITWIQNSRAFRTLKDRIRTARSSFVFEMLVCYAIFFLPILAGYHNAAYGTFYGTHKGFDRNPQDFAMQTMTREAVLRYGDVETLERNTNGRVVVDGGGRDVLFSTRRRSAGGSTTPPTAPTHPVVQQQEPGEDTTTSFLHKNGADGAASSSSSTTGAGLLHVDPHQRHQPEDVVEPTAPLPHKPLLSIWDMVPYPAVGTVLLNTARQDSQTRAHYVNQLNPDTREAMLLSFQLSKRWELAKYCINYHRQIKEGQNILSKEEKERDKHMCALFSTEEEANAVLSFFLSFRAAHVDDLVRLYGEEQMNSAAAAGHGQLQGNQIDEGALGV